MRGARVKVFWSWQSDLPGKTNRHFVKGALEDAIAALKESADSVVEPSEREPLDALHLDLDRKGVPGSPDLAATIFEKFEAASVCVADVSTVAKLEREGENGELYIKQVMNPNVAIELGYALHACGTEKLVMVMNAHYGGRDGLPFDLKHKAGPIFFNLAPKADKATIKAEQAKLAKQFETALRSYVRELRPATGAGFESTRRPMTGLSHSNLTEIVPVNPAICHEPRGVKPTVASKLRGSLEAAGTRTGEMRIVTCVGKSGPAWGRESGLIEALGNGGPRSVFNSDS